MRFPSVGVLIAVGCGAARVDAAVASEDLGAGGPPDVEMEAKGKKRGLRKLAERSSLDENNVIGDITVDSWWGDPNGPVWIAPAPPYIAPAPVPVPYTGPYPTPGAPWTGPYPTPGAPWTGPYPAPSPWTAPWTGPQPTWTPQPCIEACYIDTEISCLLGSSAYSTGLDCSTLNDNPGDVNCNVSGAPASSITFKFTGGTCTKTANTQAGDTCTDTAILDETTPRFITVRENTVAGNILSSTGATVSAIGDEIAVSNGNGVNTLWICISSDVQCATNEGGANTFQVLTVDVQCTTATDLKTCDNFGALEVTQVVTAAGTSTRPTETARFLTVHTYPATAPTGTPSTYLPATSTISFFSTTTANGVTTSDRLTGTAATTAVKDVSLDLCRAQTITHKATVTGQRSAGSHCVDTATYTWSYSET